MGEEKLVWGYGDLDGDLDEFYDEDLWGECNDDHQDDYEFPYWY